MIHQISFADGTRDLPQPLHPHPRLRGRTGGRRVAVGRADGRPAVSQAAGLRRARRAEGHRVDRRRRPRRQGDRHLLPVRRRLYRSTPRRWSRAGVAPLGAAGRRLGASQGRRSDRRAAVLQLFEARALHALRRRRRDRQAGALHAGAAARAAPAARHGLQRPTSRSSTTCRCSGTQELLKTAASTRCACTRACPSRFALIPRHGGADRHPLVRSRADLRPALPQRL